MFIFYVPYKGMFKIFKYFMVEVQIDRMVIKYIAVFLFFFGGGGKIILYCHAKDKAVTVYMRSVYTGE